MVRGCIAFLVAGLAVLATFALSTQEHVVKEANRADAANKLASVYQDTRFWVGQDESLERKYRLEPSLEVFALHTQSGNSVIADLKKIAVLDGTPAVREKVTRLLRLHQEYEGVTARMFAATRSGNTRLVEHLDSAVTDPIFGLIQTGVYGGAAIASRNALKESAALRSHETGAFKAGVLAVLLAIVLMLAMSLVIRHYRRAERRARAAELRRLSELVLTDPLTGLRNHRAFQEDLENELYRTARSGTPLALVLLDVNDLKQVNDVHGHQAGDEQLLSLARTITTTMRASDRAYRIGGDEFAAILPAVGEWAGFQFAQRLQQTLEGPGGATVRATAGVSQATELRSRDSVVWDADRALISAKRSGQAAAVYTPEMGSFAHSVLDEDEHHVRTLANALALAVDAKDPTRRATVRPSRTCAPRSAPSWDSMPSTSAGCA